MCVSRTDIEDVTCRAVMERLQLDSIRDGSGDLLAQQLIARGEHAVYLPATLSARVRKLGAGRSNNNEANAVAVAALRSPSLTPVRAADHVTVLRLRAKAQRDAVQARSPASCRLHALVRATDDLPALRNTSMPDLPAPAPELPHCELDRRATSGQSVRRRPVPTVGARARS